MSGRITSIGEEIQGKGSPGARTSLMLDQVQSRKDARGRVHASQSGTESKSSQRTPSARRRPGQAKRRVIGGPHGRAQPGRHGYVAGHRMHGIGSQASQFAAVACTQACPASSNVTKHGLHNGKTDQKGAPSPGPLTEQA
eukprot:gene14145-20108_t